MRLLSTIAAIAIAMMSSTTVQAERLVLGAVSDDQRYSIEQYTPLATYLQARLSAGGIARVEIAVFPTIDALDQAMMRGAVDLFFDSPLIAASVARTSGAVPFLRRWKDGIATYHSLILVDADSAMQTLGDLTGKVVGFEEPHSTSGYMLPAAMIRQTGHTLMELYDDETPPADAVGYVFTQSDLNSAYWLALGLVDAAATDPRGWAWLDGAQPGRFRILARSVDLPRNAAVHRRDLEPELVARVTEILLAMNATTEGRAVLASFGDTTRFDRFPIGTEATFQPIFQLLDELETMGVM
jgi:phosphonate transport system substrate-binding protein